MRKEKPATSRVAFLVSLLASVVLLSMSVASAATQMDDDFNDNSLRVERWSAGGVQGFPSSVVETNQRLEITVGPGAGGAGAYSNCFLVGNFDVQVDYSLLTWPTDNRHSLRLGAIDLPGPQGVVGLNRTSFGQEAYFYVTESGATHFAATSDTVGSMRLVRVGETVEAFFLSNGSWVSVGGPASASSNPTRIGIDLGSNDQNAPSVKAAFDNFRVVLGEVACPSVRLNLEGLSLMLDEVTNNGLKTELQNKVRQIETDLNRDQIEKACKKLNDLIKTVQDRGGKKSSGLSVSLANRLSKAGSRIQGQLDC